MKKMLLALAGMGALAGSMTANAVPFSFDCISHNSATDCQTGETQFVLDLLDTGSTFSMTFSNTGPLASSITDIYFDWQTGAELIPVASGSILAGPGVSFSWGASPGNVPAGNPIGFVANLGADSNAPTQPNGANPGEYITFNFLGSYADVLNDLLSGNLRVALHAQGFAGGGSESFVNDGRTSVPEPSTLALLGLAMAGMGFARRKRSA